MSRTPRKDPAPSLWRYRVQRWAMTRGARFVRRYGPQLVLIVAPVLFIAQDPYARAMIARQQHGVAQMLTERDGLLLSAIEITGAPPTLAAEVNTRLGLHLPVSSLAVDLPKLRTRAEQVPGVGSVRLHARGDGVLQVDVAARTPAILWRHRGLVSVHDADGVALGMIANRLEQQDLPLILGAGAAKASREALSLVRILEPLKERLRGLERMSERRWTVWLDHGQQIDLPAKDPQSALAALLRMDAREDLFGRDVTRIDLRNPARIVVGLGPQARARMMLFNRMMENAR